MFSLIKDLFTSSPDKVMDMASGVGSFIDESFYTDEEKAKAKMKFLDWKLKWLHATQGMNLARRLIALMFVFNFLFTFQVCIAVLLYGWATEQSTDGFIDPVLELAGVWQIGWIMVSIIVFYYGKTVKDHGLGLLKGKNKGE